jgi:hypothetical protein
MFSNGDGNGHGHGKKRVITAVTLAGIVLGGAVSWDRVGLPQPVWDDEFQERITILVEEHESLKSRVLNDIRLRLQRERNEIKQRIWEQRETNDKVPEWMLRQEADIQQQLEEIDRELNQLTK